MTSRIEQPRSEEASLPSNRNFHTEQQPPEISKLLSFSENRQEEEDLFRQWLQACLPALAAALGFTFLLMLCYLWFHLL
ncbi:MAG: hypothetical protein JXA25_13225 [Anaerolineales bacterium]|nr:hypothetical protein [Anaerolineales bacterium]